MSKIITTSDLQKNIGSIVKGVEDGFFIVTNRGKAKMVIMPYFDENDDRIHDYLEEYEMQKNKVKLQKKYQFSLESGESILAV